MFTNRIASYYSPGKVLIEAACLSTDAKPTTGVANGSKCIEMDTGKTYMFNEEDSEWEELPSSGGGGGGSSDLKNKTATLTFVNSTEYDFLNDEGCQCHVNENGLIEITDEKLPQANATKTISSLIVPQEGAGTIRLPMLPMSTEGTYSYVASNAVNCELQSSFMSLVEITDVTADASITLTITFTSGS